jgi:hypothetical protein
LFVKQLEEGDPRLRQLFKTGAEQIWMFERPVKLCQSLVLLS